MLISSTMDAWCSPIEMISGSTVFYDSIEIQPVPDRNSKSPIEIQSDRKSSDRKYVFESWGTDNVIHSMHGVPDRNNTISSRYLLFDRNSTRSR